MPPTLRKNKNAELHNLGNNNVVFTHRERVSLADINAGYTLLSAVPNYKYRLVDAKMIAIGGAAGVSTAAVILGTRAAAAVALMTTLIAALVQNTIVDLATANDLDAGLSFTELDDNTAITVGKTGGTMTTLTHIDFIVVYALIPSRSGA
jgi:hypothetical protein